MAGKAKVTQASVELQPADAPMYLDKARAAGMLMFACSPRQGYFDDLPLDLSDEDARQARSWMRSFAFDALMEALAEVKQALAAAEVAP